MKEEDLLKFLQTAKENRLTNAELDPFLDSCAGADFVLKFNFISRSLSFGNQKDPRYNDGHSVICDVNGLSIECSLLFTAADSAEAEALEQGDIFTSKVHVLEYDSLYQRIIFGNKGPLEVLGSSHVNESKSDEKAVTEHNADRADLIEESREEAPREISEQLPDPPRSPQRPLVPRRAVPVILNENEGIANVQPKGDLDSGISDSSNTDVGEGSVERSEDPSNDPLIFTQSSPFAGCVSGFFLCVGVPITLVGCVTGPAPSLIGLILIGIGVAVKFADSEGKDYSLKKALTKRSGDKNSKSNKGTNWALLYSFYVAGAFLLYSGITKPDMILVLIGLVLIGIGIVYRKATYDRDKEPS